MNLNTVAAVTAATTAVLGVAACAYGSRKMLEAEASLIEGLINGYQLPTDWDSVREVEIEIKVEDVIHRVKQRAERAVGVVEKVRDNACDWVNDQVERFQSASSDLAEAVSEDLVCLRVKPTIVPMHVFEEDSSVPFEVGDAPVTVEFARAVHKVKSLINHESPLLELLLRTSQQLALHPELLTSQIMVDHSPTDSSALAYVLSKEVESLEGPVKQIHELGLIIDGVEFSVEVLQHNLTQEFYVAGLQESTGNWDELALLLDTTTLVDDAEVVETVNSMLEALALKTQGVLGTIRVYSSTHRPRLVNISIEDTVIYEETLGYNSQGQLGREFVELDKSEQSY